MERSEQLSIAEALILASPEPIPLPRLASLIPSCKPAMARGLVEELNAASEPEWGYPYAFIGQREAW